MTEHTIGEVGKGLLAIVPALALVVVAAAGLGHLRQSTLDAHQHELTVLSIALADEIDRGLQDAQEGIQAIRFELQEDRLPLQSDEAQRALRLRAELMPEVTRLWIVDAAGRVVAASDASPLPPLSTFAPALDRLGGEAMAISTPFPDAAAGPRRPDIGVAMRLVDPSVAGGSGWIVAALPARALLGAFPAAAPAADARIAVLRVDGALLAGSPADVGADAPSRAAALHADAPRLAVEGRRSGGQRLVAIRHLRHLGLVVVLARDAGPVLAGWRRTAQVTAAGIALLLAVVAASAWRVRRADLRRAQAQRALQAQLARASKLEALGTLAGVVAHDFNNMLAAIVGFGEMAQEDAVRGSAQERQIGKVLQAAARGKALIARILAFSRGGARVCVVFELEPLLEEALAMQAASLPDGIVIERSLAAPGARLRGDPTQVFEAVMNLCVNAVQAMPQGGRLVVRLASVQVTAARVLSHSRIEPGAYLQLSVEDTGIGMTAQILERLFEPFFTTRGAQAGTGLGLAVVHGVVTEFGGAIDVRSAPGQGTCVTLYLPECPEAESASSTSEAESVPMGRGQRVLLVDDEPALVEVGQELLARLGYQCDGHLDSVAALQAVGADPDRYAAVITDEVMPGLTGTELAARLIAVRRDLPVILLTGYGGSLLASRAARLGITQVLRKPLQRAELARALESILG